MLLLMRSQSYCAYACVYMCIDAFLSLPTMFNRAMSNTSNKLDFPLRDKPFSVNDAVTESVYR